MEYMVVYDSQSGNTEKIAMQIFEALPGKSKDIQRITNVTGTADVYFVGFWNYKGTCSVAVMDFLSQLHGKQIALFGTSGAGSMVTYGQQVLGRVAALIPDDNQFLGDFICTGKMPLQILNQYRALFNQYDTPQTRTMIKMYEEGMLHPDQQDLDAVKIFTGCMLSKKEESYGN